MKRGKAFELFVKYLLISVGFLKVDSTGLYFFDGAPGQMILELGKTQNEDFCRVL